MLDKLLYSKAIAMSENGSLPDQLTRIGIRRLLQQRLQEIHAGDHQQGAQELDQLLRTLHSSEIAQVPDLANQQHYEVPSELFQQALGKHLKYSCSYWADDTSNLDDAETQALELTVKHADIENGMSILELGCGWGSLSLWMAAHFPDSKIVAVSNSGSQASYIVEQAKQRELSNLTVLTEDMNTFAPKQSFDRVVSVEMFEHMRNWPALFQRIHRWLKPNGKFFMHVFAHQHRPYLFEDKDDNDWMSRYFFSGGLMPSIDLPLFFQDHLKIEQRWLWNGEHYAKSAEAWLQNFDNSREPLQAAFEQTYGDQAELWWTRWRLFFIACAELFAYNKGQEWLVGHYLFQNRLSAP